MAGIGGCALNGEHGRPPHAQADDWIPPDRAATFPTGKGPTVVVDAGHGNWHTISGRFAPFARLLGKDGYEVIESRGETTSAVLNSADVFIIANAVKGALTDSGLTNGRVLDLSSAFNGRRLCENTVGLYEEKGIAGWTSPGAVDNTEWINQIRTVSTCCSNSPYYIQESLHPNYWAQLATRSCVRQAYNGGTPRGGACRISGTGLINGEPRMTLN